MKARNRIATGAAIGLGGDTLAHALGVSHLDGLLVAFALFAVAMAVDVVNREAGQSPSKDSWDYTQDELRRTYDGIIEHAIAGTKPDEDDDE